MIRTQKDRKLQTLIEVCTDFSSLSTSSHLHRPAEQTFAVHQSDETSYMENEYNSEEMFAVGDRAPWTNRRLPETPGVPTLQQMFALAQRMGYEMRPISRQTDAPRQQVDHLLARTGVSAPNHKPDVTTRSFVVSAVASLITCRHVVQNQTRHCHTHQLVGFSSLRAMDREIKETGQKTHPRSGLHPPWSTRASFDPHSSFSHQIIMGFTITE